MSLFNINYHKIASINIFSYQEYDVFVKAISWIINGKLVAFDIIGDEIVVQRQPMCIGGQLIPIFLSETEKECPSKFPQIGHVLLSRTDEKIYDLIPDFL